METIRYFTCNARIRSSLTFLSNNARQIFLLLLHLICILFDLAHTSTFSNGEPKRSCYGEPRRVCLSTLCLYMFRCGFSIFPSLAVSFLPCFSRHGTFQSLIPYTRFSDTHGMLNSRVSLTTVLLLLLFLYRMYHIHRNRLHLIIGFFVQMQSRFYLSEN